MAKVIEFDKKHFGRNGHIQLTRGDDWSLEAKIVDERGSYQEEVNLADSGIVGATGYFKAEDGTRVSTEIVLPTCPEFKIELPSSGSELAQKAENGIDMYIELENSDGDRETVYTYAQPLAIVDQGFTQF